MHEAVDKGDSSLWLKAIIAKNRDSFLIKVPVDLPEKNVRIEEITGNVVIEAIAVQSPFVVVSFVGSIQYQELNEAVCRKIDFLQKSTEIIEGLTWCEGEVLRIYSVISDLFYFLADQGQGWQVMAKINYTYYLTRLQKFDLFWAPATETRELVRGQKYLIKKNCSFYYSFELAALEKEETLLEIRVSIPEKKELFLKKELLMSGTFAVEVVWQKAETTYLKGYQFDFDELIILDTIKESHHLLLDSELVLSNYLWKQEAGGLNLQMETKYHFNIFQTVLAPLLGVKVNQESLILAEKVVSQKETSLLREKKLVLKETIAELKECSPKIINLSYQGRQGWVYLKVVLEVRIAYISTQKSLREELFHFTEEMGFIWEEIKIGQEFLITVDVEYHKLINQQLFCNYLYLLKIKGALIAEEELLLTQN